MMERGHLKIFFSYAESIGKTLAMLKAAKGVKDQGVDVVAGCVGSHMSHETLALLEEFERLSQGEEFDLDGALLRKPDLILIDELAHSNAKGSRHRKRYQDIDELLKAGIDVYTTVNVGNIESLHDTVIHITGGRGWERIPDFVFDQADQVELIDIEPQELIQRAGESPFTAVQLTALREAALRRCADRVRRLADGQQKNTFHTHEHILVCLSSAPSNAKIIRTAARMARAFNSQFTALFVETPEFVEATEQNKQRLRDNEVLAEQLGAHIETVYGEDVPYQIAEFARLFGITKIVLGRSVVTRKVLPGKMPLTEQLIAYVPEIDIHIIPDKSAENGYRPHKAKKGILENTVKSGVILTGATILSLGFYRLGFTEANIIMVYILGVLLTSTVTSHQIYSLVSSIASVFIFNFLFTHPRFSLTAYETGYPVTFVVMFLTAYITGTFAIRYKEQAGQSAKIAYRTKILFDTDQMLSKAGNRAEITEAVAKQMGKLLGRRMVMFDNGEGEILQPRFFGPDGMPMPSFFEEKGIDGGRELETARWVLKNNHGAGAGTDTLSDAACTYLALRVNERVYGAVGIETKDSPLEAAEHGIVLSILGECALALENEKNVREKEEAAVLAESEQLRANLLRTISHDLRTPLTTISGNASNLMNSGDSFDEETKRQIYRDIYDDSMWLINLVENLLYATRIEEGRMTLNASTELLSDLVEEAVKHAGRQAAGHHLSTVCDDDLILVKADGKLVVQVIANMVDNAVKYTREGSSVTVTTGRDKNMAVVRVADNGDGIPDGEKTKVFEKFYCGDNKIADNRRSLGLGLYLCRAIVEAHGGCVQVTDNETGGAVFSFTLPLEEVTIYE